MKTDEASEALLNDAFTVPPAERVSRRFLLRQSRFVEIRERTGNVGAGPRCYLTEMKLSVSILKS